MGFFALSQLSSFFLHFCFSVCSKEFILFLKSFFIQIIVQIVYIIQIAKIKNQAYDQPSVHKVACINFRSPAEADNIISNFLKAAFCKFYLVHSWIPWPMQTIGQM